MQTEEPKVCNDAAAQPAVLTATIQITRKATGKVEEYTLVGTAAEVKSEAGRIPALKEAP
jgi:hypothetical protein